MNYKPCPERTFLFELAPFVLGKYEDYLRWLNHLLERLGKKCTHAVWQVAFTDYDDELLVKILANGWKEITNEQNADIGNRIDSLVPKFFPVPVAGVSGEEARQLIELTPPLNQIRKRS